MSDCWMCDKEIPRSTFFLMNGDQPEEEVFHFYLPVIEVYPIPTEGFVPNPVKYSFRKCERGGIQSIS